MVFHSQTLPDFWHLYNQLPEQIKQRASRQYELFKKNPRHPSLHLKPVGEFWSARVSDSYRALAIREGNTFIWFWIGTHDQYERLIKD